MAEGARLDWLHCTSRSLAEKLLGDDMVPLLEMAVTRDAFDDAKDEVFQGFGHEGFSLVGRGMLTVEGLSVWWQIRLAGCCAVAAECHDFELSPSRRRRFGGLRGEATAIRDVVACAVRASIPGRGGRPLAFATGNFRGRHQCRFPRREVNSTSCDVPDGELVKGLSSCRAV